MNEKAKGSSRRGHRRNPPRAASRLHKSVVSLTALAFMGLIGWNVVNAAEGDGETGATRTWGGGKHGMHGGGPMGFMSRRLGLSEEQQKQIGDILAASRTESEPLREKMHAMREEIRREVKENGYDEDAVRVIVENNIPAFVDMTLLSVRTMNSVNDVLTPEQQAQAEEMMQSWRERRGRGFGGGYGMGSPDTAL